MLIEELVQREKYPSRTVLASRSSNGKPGKRGKNKKKESVAAKVQA